MSNKLKIAILQISPFKTDQRGNLLKGDRYCRKAKKKNADIILFPEMWNIGYEIFNEVSYESGSDPGNITKTPDEKILKVNALDLDSDFINHFKELACELETAIAITFLQNGKSKPLNSVVLIDRHGKIVLNYSKVHTCDFALEYLLEPGQEFFACDLDTKKGVVKIGAMICFDREFPESARELLLQGAEIILIPNCCNMDSHRSSQLKTRAFENMTGIALANYPFPKCNGRSQAYSPVVYDIKGAELDNLLLMADGEEGIFFAEFDMEKIREYRKREVWGNTYRKPSAYKHINGNNKII